MIYTRFFINGSMIDAKRLSYAPNAGERVTINGMGYTVERRDFDLDAATINIYLTEELA